MTREPNHEKRRKVLGAAARYSLLGALGLVTGRLIAKNAAGPLDPDEQCTNRGRCRGCRLLGGCRSPQAKMFLQGQDR
jgi:hypothetical protein